MKVECLFIFFIYSQCFSQVLQNGDLDGTPGQSALPTYWEQVPYTDPNSNSTGVDQSTSDLTSASLPGGSISGNPFSGITFTSGLYCIGSEPQYFFHEGLMQTVPCFRIGETYQIRFYQAVTKQLNDLDQSGSWSVFIDNTLLGISVPTFSNEPISSTSIPWELRTFNFTATTSTHTIKFLPTDDDANNQSSTVDITGGLRMGIDSINLVKLSGTPFSLGLDTTLCYGDNLTLDASSVVGDYLWQNNSTNSSLNVTQEGAYWVRIVDDNNCVVSDTIQINYIEPNQEISNGYSICFEDSLLLDVTTPNANYLWQNNSTDSTLLITESGDYWVEISTPQCLFTIPFSVEQIACEVEIEMPNVFSPNEDGVNDFFKPIDLKIPPTSQLEFVILNRWGNVIYRSSKLDEGWDGNSGGKECADGVYFWKIEVSDETSNKIFSGMLELIR